MINKGIYLSIITETVQCPYLPVWSSLRFMARLVTGEFIFDGAILSVFKKLKLLLRFFNGKRNRGGFFEMLLLDIFQNQGKTVNEMRVLMIMMMITLTRNCTSRS